MRMASLKGKRIRDWQIEGLLGEGGMGQVWRARHTTLNRHFAIKVIADDLLSDPKFESLFIREAGTQAQLQHPHIIPATDFFVEDGFHCLVMPYIEGQSLEERLEKNKNPQNQKRTPLPQQEAMAIAFQVLHALDYAHKNRVIHRDVKPSNILLDRRGDAYLTDFGVAVKMDKPRTTSSGKVVGTSSYMSPEQIQRPREMDHRTDVYSFACVLYEMLAGGPVFDMENVEGDTDFYVKESHIKRTPDQLRKRNPSVSAEVEAVVAKALAKSPNDRFGGCGEFARELGKALEGTESLIRCPGCRAKNRIATTDQLTEAKCTQCSQPFLPVVKKPEPPKPYGWIAVTGLLTVLSLITIVGWVIAADNAAKQELQRRNVETELSSTQSAKTETESQLQNAQTQIQQLQQKVSGYEAPSTIILKNNSSETIQYLKMNKSHEAYGEDRLGRDVLLIGREFRFSVPPGVYKLWVKTDDGVECHMGRVDVVAGVEKKLEIKDDDQVTCKLRLFHLP